MATIQIKKSDLISELAAAAKYFGSTEWDIYVKVDGTLDTRHNTHFNHGWDVLVDLYYLSLEDENGNLPGDADYDSKGVAKWLVNETDLTLSDIEFYNDETEELEVVDIELV